jgi:hypothetical protein
MRIKIRNARLEDISQILRVEQSWPIDGRASAEKFIARLDKFSQGFFLACIDDAEGHELIVATITSMPLHYDPASVSQFKCWDSVTANGFLPQFNLAQCNALYIVSGVIDSEYRGLNIFGPMVLKVASLASTLGLRYVLAGAVLPGYQKYCSQHGDIPAYDYCATRRGQHLLDPLLAMYESIAFEVPDAAHVLAEYYPDDASRNFAALVVRDLNQAPL